MTATKSGRHYDVAISFAGEDRRFAEALANSLRERSVSVFYDQYEKAALWGKNLYTHLSDLYRNQAQYCILLLSRHYASKVWTRHEREAAQARAFNENREYILPVRLDETEVPGILPTVGYLRWPPENEGTIADAVVAKLAALFQEPLPPSVSLTPGAATATKTIAVGLYCSTCGAAPANPSKCTVGYSHSFVERSENVYCRTCGAMPGESTSCTVGYSHSFVSLKGAMYCRTCGAMPGKATKCTVGYSHSFVGT